MQSSRKQHDSKKQGRWTPEEHEKFMAAIATYGKDWKKVQQIVGTRSGSQVRSHAQKFFNKLLKQQNQKKSQGPKQRSHQAVNQHHEQESSQYFMRFIHDDGSMATPIQLVSLIKKESQNNINQTNKIDIKNFQKKLEQQMAVIKEEQNEDQTENLLKQTSYQSLSNILQAYSTIKEPNKNIEYQNQSFLMSLAKHYKRYFKISQNFEKLFDFGQPSQQQNTQKVDRKRSFTLPEGVQGNEQELNQRKKRVIMQQNTIKMTESQKESFKNAIKNRADKEKKQNQSQLKNQYRKN